MPSQPKATTTPSATAGATAGGTDILCVVSPCATSADGVPRLFGSAAAIYAQHDYCEGVEYAAHHAEKARKPILFVGIPIVTQGAISRENKAGNTGSSATTITAGGSGVLAEHDGVLRALTSGTVGTDQILLELSLDGGVSFQRIRLGTATSYVLPYVGATVGFSVGTLVAGDTIHTWHGSAPRGDAAGMLLARTKLAAQQTACRSILLCQDLQDDTEAAAFLAQLDAYRTANERFVYGRAGVLDRLPQAAMSRDVVRMTGSPTLTFAEVGATGDTITRSSGSFIADGFVNGDVITVAGSAGNNVTGKVATVAALVLTLDTTDLVAEGPVSGCTITGTPGITFLEVGATGDTITRNRGSWLTDGFRTGDLITIAGTVGNDQTATAGLANVTPLVLTLGTTDVVNETIGASAITITAGQTKAAWMAAITAEFGPIDAAPRIDLSAGRRRLLSPFSAWNRRLPIAQLASIREYQTDLHVATWRKSDGPVSSDTNADEWDDLVDGGAGGLARFTVARSYANGPQGAYISQSCTRASEGSLLVMTHNQAVTDLACTINQAATENFIGRGLILNDDGTATGEDLSQLESEVNSALELALYQDRGFGKRCSKVVWAASKDDILNVPEALVTGVLTLNLLGTIHSVTTAVKVK